MAEEILCRLHLPPPLTDMATTDRIRWGLVVAVAFLWAACEAAFVGGKQRNTIEAVPSLQLSSLALFLEI